MKLVSKLGVLFCLGLSFAVSAQQKNTSKPNIIFILTDDLGYGDIGVFYQNERKARDNRAEPWTSTPNLDQMAHEGVMLTHHYAAAPVCAPSRSSLLTGLSQGHANVRDNQFDKALSDNYTIGNVTQKLGYATAAIGKWGLQGSREEGWPSTPNKRGFDYFYGYMRHRDGHEHYPVEGIYRGAKEVWENETEVSKGLDKCYTTDLWTAVAKKWIVEQAKAEKPFFMFLAYDTPHAVLELPTQEYPIGGGVDGGVQWLGTSGKMINTASGKPDSYMHPDYAKATYDDDHNENTPEVAWPETYKRYATSVRRIDNAVGDILKLLKDLDIDDNTMVIFTSDNGPSAESYLPKGYVANTPDFFDSFGPFDGLKRDVLEGGERLPLIARWPGKIPANSKVKTSNISHDWLPTFTDVAGCKAPAISDGVSLMPALTGKGKQLESLVYSEYVFPGKTPGYDDFSINNRNRNRNQMQMIRFNDMVGIRYDIQSADDDFEIYDVINDTHQSQNLAKDGHLADLQKRMKAEVLRMRRTNPTAKRPYDEAPVPALKKSVSKLGFKWQAFTGDYPWLPNLSVMKPTKSGKVSNLEKIDFQKREESLYLINGYINIPNTGTYTFHFNTVHKAVVKLHKALLFDADYGYQSGDEKSTTMVLEKGVHPIKIYLSNPNQAKIPFSLTWKSNTSRVFNSSDIYR
ncbi:sulfatase-like hydrolase/transferase [Aestuariibaculum sediminum]|uniref:Sulfatase-like hydrolase/transferase n=1 Tax=Aestuariibaculum sediminum TaxID=2770637 RepID=A0A8J6U8A6_9FLAO|nr:sulfatase-like hydrolase/transferase [Aestuariibaculum sediminum]MBD0832993.1 sulfatase-like hydrolase/transferase [Aestuariibaculum sediminum]